MNFQPDLARAVIAGRKTVTRRAVNFDNPNSHYWHEQPLFKSGGNYAVCPGRGKPAIGRMLVIAIHREEFAPAFITYAESRREGFFGVGDFLAAWEEINGSLDALPVWRIDLMTYKSEEQ